MPAIYYGRAAGITKKDAETWARRTYKIPKNVKVHLEYLYRDAPFTVYEVETDLTKRRK